MKLLKSCLNAGGVYLYHEEIRMCIVALISLESVGFLKDSLCLIKGTLKGKQSSMMGFQTYV